ncbi:MAG: hypothetical protein EOO88_13720 [Pedobacter sp.]|nr:MAG: hypothetical protein EOO88_13720 [Pedobacter sp.]
MKNLLFLLLVVLHAGAGSAQRSDGFFVQELCFVDPVLLRQLQVDKIEVKLTENFKKKKKFEVYLDSSQRLIRKVITAGDSVSTIEYPGAPLSLYACPTVNPGYVKECVNGRVTRTQTPTSLRVTEFDAAG